MSSIARFSERISITNSILLTNFDYNDIIYHIEKKNVQNKELREISFS